MVVVLIALIAIAIVLITIGIVSIVKCARKFDVLDYDTYVALRHQGHTHAKMNVYIDLDPAELDLYEGGATSEFVQMYCHCAIEE